ncbi:MAG TPA: SIMPL domain-containing protein [Candidatus Paceibacterota bacterium]|nr:SIMPL domain-containing protein [Candidatus Paceibacterota bacterium]
MNNNMFDELFSTGGVRIALTGALSILALFLLAQTITTAENFGRPSVPATDTVTVNGSGQATLAPDVARVSFTVQNTAPAVADAQAATTKQANAVLGIVKAQGIADKDVKTLSYNISPQYSYPRPCTAGVACPPYGAPTITGYQVSESIQVTVRDLSSVGTLLADLGKLAVQNVSGPDFTLDDTTAGYDAARADAIAKAKAQAALLSSQLGVTLGKIVNFSENSGGYPTPVYAMAAGTSAKSEATPNVPVGENTYNASVSITYEIR